MIPTYQRETTAAAVDTIPDALRKHLVETAARHHVRLEGAQVWLTRHINPPARGLAGRLFGRRQNPADPDAEHMALVVLLRTHLLVGSEGAARGTSVLCAPLRELVVERGYGLRSGAGASEGLTVTGFAVATHGEASGPSSFFVGLEDAPEGHRAAQALLDAVKLARSG